MRSSPRCRWPACATGLRGAGADGPGDGDGDGAAGTAQWLHGVLRGRDDAPVRARHESKSMMSAKAFRPAIHSLDEAGRWLRVLVADLFARCVERDDDVDDAADDDANSDAGPRRRPRTMALHHRHGVRARARHAPVPAGAPLSAALLLRVARGLLAAVVAKGRAWPCANLALSISGFEDVRPRAGGVRALGEFWGPAAAAATGVARARWRRRRRCAA